MSFLPPSLARLSALILLSMLGGVMAAPRAVADTRIGTVFSTAAEGMQSYLRLYNASGSPGQATVLIMDFSNGQVLGQWISPSIPGGAEQQYDISTIEAALPISTARPYYYSLAVQAGFDGYLQHVLWRVTDGTLTNLSTCGGGVTADRAKLTGIHSTLLSGKYPSSVSINNLGAAQSVTVGVYDARDGTRLGTFNTPTIAANGMYMASSLMIEAMIGRGPSDSAMYHYVVKLETPFNGFVQHLVNNLQAGVVTDMTIGCAMNQ